MDKKKIVIKIILAICVIAIIAGIIILTLKKQDNTPTIISKPLNESVNLEHVFGKIEELEKIDIEIPEGEENPDINMEEKTDYKEEAKEIDFKEYEVLEKGAIVKTTDEEINEVWMIKLGSYEQQEAVCRILGNRVQKLKNAYGDNEIQNAILNNAVIKQEDGIVIMIISANATEIEETIANEM